MRVSTRITALVVSVEPAIQSTVLIIVETPKLTTVDKVWNVFNEPLGSQK